MSVFGFLELISPKVNKPEVSDKGYNLLLTMKQLTEIINIGTHEEAGLQRIHHFEIRRMLFLYCIVGLTLA